MGDSNIDVQMMLRLERRSAGRAEGWRPNRIIAGGGADVNDVVRRFLGRAGRRVAVTFASPPVFAGMFRGHFALYAPNFADAVGCA